MPLLDTLRASSLFGELDPASLDLLSRLFVERPVRGGEILVHQGDRVHPVGDALFIVTDGAVAVQVEGRTGGGGVETLAVLGPGDAFGVASLVDPAPRAASCVVVEPGRVAVLARRTLDALVHSDLALAARVEHALARQLARDLRVFNRHLRARLGL
jgi:CRP-like cAMP-binding protein